MAANMPSVLPPPPGRPLWEPRPHSVLTHNAAGGREVCLPPSPTHPLHPSDLMHNVVNLYQFNRSSLKRNMLYLSPGLRNPQVGIRSPVGARKCPLLQNPDRF